VVRDYIYIKDLADLCVQAGVSSSMGVFNVGNGEGYSINEIISILASVSGKKIKTNYINGRPYDVPQITLDISKVMNEFSWEPRTDLLKGMKETWDCAVRQKNEHK
jgi:UDP-glucose 4-epimerase